MSDFVVVIPARYASERLPGKPLREIAGKAMIEHVYRRGKESGASAVIVATDDERIRDASAKFVAEVVMTSEKHRSGTERLAEVSDILGWPESQVVVNLQGDEPLMPAALIDQCAALLDDDAIDIATLASPLANAGDFRDPNVVKVITDANGDAIYFSRAAIPYSRHAGSEEMARSTALHHHGIYAYRVGVLRRFVRAEHAAIEECEQLEQLRALSLGMNIRVGVPEERPGPGVDTVDDLRKAAELLEGA